MYALPRALAMRAAEIEVIRDSIFRSSSSLGKVRSRSVGPGRRREPCAPAIRWSVISSRLGTRDERIPGGRCQVVPVPAALRSVCGAGHAGDGCTQYRRCQLRCGGDEETRTPDPLLAKEMLCQLSYVPKDERRCWGWWAFLDSNQRPLPYQGSALTS
jgi:hypothetical protein